MKITQISARKYTIEMSNKEFLEFSDTLTRTQRQVVTKALKAAFAEAIRGWGKVNKYQKELKEINKKLKKKGGDKNE